MQNVFVFDHPLIQHKVSLLRDKNTSAKEFRELVAEISVLMCYEVTRDIPLKEIELETPVGFARTKVISGKKIGHCTYIKSGARHGRRLSAAYADGSCRSYRNIQR